MIIKKLIIFITILELISIQIYAMTENEKNMITAVKAGDTKTIQTLLSQNVNPNMKDERGYSLIHIAAENNKIESIKALKNSRYTDFNILLQSNSTINIQNNMRLDASYYSAMDIAAVNNNFDIVKLLMDYGANINFQIEYKPRSEFLASRYSTPKILELFLNKNIYLLMNSEDVISLIKSAVLGNNVPNINYLVKNLGIDVDTKDTNTMLHYAVGEGSVKALNELIKLRANVNNTNSNFQTPLHYAIENNTYRMKESVSSLLLSRANPNIKDKNGNTALHLAVMNAYKSADYIDIMNNLIKNNADVNILNNNNQNALNIAVENNNTDISNILINAKANLNNIHDGYAPIHIAVKNNNISILRNLLLNKAYIDIKDEKKGYTPLCIAIENNNFDICKMLITNNASMDNNAINLVKNSTNENIKRLLESGRVN